MSAAEPFRGHAVVMQPNEGRSYWQPVPASGHADPKLVPADTRFDGLSMGFQTIAPGGRSPTIFFLTLTLPRRPGPGTRTTM